MRKDREAWDNLFGDAPEHLMLAWREYHKNNPHVYRAFAKLAFEMRARRTHYSADTIMHKLRWDTDIEGAGDPFKINDHYTPFYVRLLIYEHPATFIDFFQLRRQGVKRG